MFLARRRRNFFWKSIENLAFFRTFWYFFQNFRPKAEKKIHHEGDGAKFLRKIFFGKNPSFWGGTVLGGPYTNSNRTLPLEMYTSFSVVMCPAAIIRSLY